MAYFPRMPYSQGYPSYGGAFAGQSSQQQNLGGSGQFPYRLSFPSTPEMPYSQGFAQAEAPAAQGRTGGPAASGAAGGGFNVGGAIQGAEQLMTDIGGIGDLANTNTDHLVDHSFDAQSPYDNVGAFDEKKNPFDQSAGAVIGKVGGNAAKYAAIGTSIAPGIGTAIGAGVGALLGGVQSIFGASKQKEFAASQARAKARYQALKNQQLNYRQQQQNNMAQTNYLASRFSNSYNY